MSATGMDVRLIAVTGVTEHFWRIIDDSKMYNRADYNSADAELLVEAAGRICYDSFNLPNEKTATNQGYLANIKRQMHYSVLEHASYTFYVGGVSRALLAEISRHRHLGFSVRSQRYCDEGDSGFVVPPVLAKNPDTFADEIAAFEELQRHARIVYREIQSGLLAEGVGRKTANDAARYALTEATATELFLTGNGRAWLEVLGKRESAAAAEEIRTLAFKIHGALKDHSTNIYTTED